MFIKRENYIVSFDLNEIRKLEYSPKFEYIHTLGCINIRTGESSTYTRQTKEKWEVILKDGSKYEITKKEYDYFRKKLLKLNKVGD